MKSGTEVVMDQLPTCDIPGCRMTASYDGATKAGPWAYMCDDHFALMGRGLGLGVGQRLILRTSDAGEAVER